MKIRYTAPDKFEMLRGEQWLYITNPQIIPKLTLHHHPLDEKDLWWFFEGEIIGNGLEFDIEDVLSTTAQDGGVARIFDTTGNYMKFPGPGTIVITLHLKSATANQTEKLFTEWYSAPEIQQWLISQNYSKDIAEELSTKWANDLQGAFNKGYEKATRDFAQGIRDKAKSLGPPLP